MLDSAWELTQAAQGPNPVQRTGNTGRTIGFSQVGLIESHPPFSF
jgi:hypothetical protein